MSGLDGLTVLEVADTVIIRPDPQPDGAAA